MKQDLIAAGVPHDEAHAFASTAAAPAALAAFPPGFWIGLVTKFGPLAITVAQAILNQLAQQPPQAGAKPANLTAETY